MRDHAPPYFEPWVQTRIVLVRHDQPAKRVVDPETVVLECDNQRCRRLVLIVFVPGAIRYYCPFCDGQLTVHTDPGGMA